MDTTSLQPRIGDPTAEVTFILDAPIPESITFTVTPIYVEDALKHPSPDPAKVLEGVLIAAVRTWNLTSDGVPVLCDEEHKRKYLPVLFGMRVKAAPGFLGEIPFNSSLKFLLLGFCGNPEYFTKEPAAAPSITSWSIKPGRHGKA